MRVVHLLTEEEKGRGLQFAPEVGPGVVLFFHDVREGAVFHSRNVPGPFDLVFLDASGAVIDGERMRPPDQVAVAPPGSAAALESAAGSLVAP